MVIALRELSHGIFFSLIVSLTRLHPTGGFTLRGLQIPAPCSSRESTNQQSGHNVLRLSTTVTSMYLKKSHVNYLLEWCE